jgi:uncharacterized GH25 family protein
MSRVLVSLLLLVVLGGAYWLYSQTDSDVPLPTPVDHGQPPPAVTEPPPVTPGAAASAVVAPERQPVREVATVDNSHADAAQGVKGRVLLPNGQPAAGVPLFLMETMMNNPFEILRLSKSGQTLPPVASGAAAADGTFALGALGADKEFDLRIVSDAHPEVNHKSLKVRGDEWYDVGTLTLEDGTLLHGRVVDEFSKAGVPEATVYLQLTNNVYSALPTPGRERGIAAVTGTAGEFRIACPANPGAVTLTAEAAGYATTVLSNRVANSPGQELVIEIARGQPIAGVVVDAEGRPLSNVQVRAQGMSIKTPQSATTSTARDGVFQFACLREGPYELTTSSTGHGEAKSPPVLTGDLDVKLVLAQLPWVKLKVLAANGQPVKAYQLALMRYFPNNALGIGKVPEFPNQRVMPNGAWFPGELGGDWAAIRGLPPEGQFCFQIEERNHAKTLSQPFTVTLEQPTEVIAQLTAGASITGQVVDDRGQPLRGATVATDMNNAFDGDAGGIFAIFKQMMPEKHSVATVTTDAQGRFTLRALAFADYMVRISHQSFCVGESFDITLSQEGQVVDVGVVQLRRGVLIEGYTSLGGQAIGQVKVTLSVPPEDQPKPPIEGGANNESKQARMPFSASAVSDNDGRCVLLKRVPPGRYTIAAARQSGGQDPFSILLVMKETERVIEVGIGQERLQVDFSLPAR